MRPGEADGCRNLGVAEALPLEASEWVAIIDDDAPVRSSLSRLFRAHGIRSVTFGSAEDYLRRTMDVLPRCILLDVQLIGGLSGTDLQERLESEGIAPPIIFMTGQDEIRPSLLERFPELNDCLRKPFDMGRLLARVRPHLQPVVVPSI
jgi:FixJ family two-component response regulator